eukprot:TRINITY_DN20971_c0_g1_i1.p1 TRINITY_DN20971_c0_g1~~TRINITY_DN20971_c0_g1_i1.p1  ORF type:complete len:589 (+),score=99.75 TRINITY_DN20971_c0_g1_i1:67-1833(+)
MKSLLVAAAFLAGVAPALGEMKVMIPMRDGTNLSTYINCPIIGEKKKTIIFDTSPYGHDGSEEMAAAFATALGPEDYCSVRQDMRGSGDSIQGQDFSIWRTQANDSYDTFKWLAGQPWSNGEIYQCGGSADGIASIMSWPEHPPALKKQFIMWASINAHQLTYPGGAFRNRLITHWFHHFPGQTQRLIDVAKEHEAPGPYWNPVNITDRCDEINFPAVFLGGWYDIFTKGNINAYECYKKSGKPTYLIMESCGHCIAKDCPIYLVTDARTEIAFVTAVDVFAGRTPPSEIRNITFFVMGAGNKDSTYIDPFAPGNYWTSVDDWPVFNPVKFYMNTGGVLSTQQMDTPATQSFLYDPTNPVPTIGGNNLEMACGAKDQQNTSSKHRADVLDFTSDILKEDFAITGPLVATLYVSSNCTDTDFTAKLTHVHPDGRAILINDGIIRMRWRHGTRDGINPQLMTPNEIYEIKVSLWNTSFIFPKGHQFRVSISSSNYPRFDANPNNGKPIMNNTGPIIFAENTLHMGHQYASYFTMPVVTQEQLPRVNWNAVMDKWLDDRPDSYRLALDMFRRGKMSKAKQAAFPTLPTDEL